jgi:predicted Na+-dependent transporter
MLRALNRFLEKRMPAIAPSSVIVGVLLADYLTDYTMFVPWIFAVMTFAGSLNSDFRDLKNVLLHPLTILVCMLVLHGVIPLIAWLTGLIAFANDPLTITGLVLAFVIPTGISSFVWVAMFRGSVALTLAIILIDTLLSPFIVPYTLYAFVGASVEIDIWGMMSGLLWMVVLPSLAGMSLQQWSKGRARERLSPVLAPFSKLGLGAVIILNSAVVAPYFRTFSWKLAGIIVTVLVLASAGYLVGWAAARLFRWNRGTAIALTLNSGMRNISAGAVLAMHYFAPAVALPVVCCMLFQQVLASVFTSLLRRVYGEADTASIRGDAPQVGLVSAGKNSVNIPN